MYGLNACSGVFVPTARKCISWPGPSRGTVSSGGNSTGTPQPGSVQSAGQGVTTGGGERSAGTSFSPAFADCMRAHGVPKFPDPDSKASQFGPGSGVDPASQAFQVALNGLKRHSPAPPARRPPGQVSGGS